MLLPDSLWIRWCVFTIGCVLYFITKGKWKNLRNQQIYKYLVYKMYCKFANKTCLKIHQYCFKHEIPIKTTVFFILIIFHNYFVFFYVLLLYTIYVLNLKQKWKVLPIFYRSKVNCYAECYINRVWLHIWKCLSPFLNFFF